MISTAITELLRQSNSLEFYVLGSAFTEYLCYGSAKPAGDIDEESLTIARQTYQNQFDIRRMDAQELPFGDKSLDVIILFEAIYYLQDPAKFVREAKRVLRHDGTVVVCNPNKDLSDFNPSPFSHRYFNPPEFCELFEPMNFVVKCYGDSPISLSSFKSRTLSSLKKLAVKLHVIPKTMKGKVLLKRIVFGELTVMPASLPREKVEPVPLTVIPKTEVDLRHQVIFCVARKA